jgi:hypothetical protein
MGALSRVHRSNRNVLRQLKIVSISYMCLDAPDTCSADGGCACKSISHSFDKKTDILSTTSGPAYTACTVLLFDAAQRLLYGQRDRAKALLANSEECINVLDGRGEAACFAMDTPRILLPLHRELQNLACTEPCSRPKSGIYNLLEDPQSLTAFATPLMFAPAIPTMQRAIEALGTPFWGP